MSRTVSSLYELSLKANVSDCITQCQCCRKEYRVLPDHVLFDFYYKVFSEKRVCLLVVELQTVEVLTRFLKLHSKRALLLKMVQSVIDHNDNVLKTLVESFKLYDCDSRCDCTNILRDGIRLGAFCSEGGWYMEAIEIYDICERILFRKGTQRDADVLRLLLEILQRKLHAQACYCLFPEAEKTVEVAERTIEELKELGDLPNLAAIYSNYSALYFRRSEYDKAYKWTKKAMEQLDDTLPTRVIIDVLRQASKSSVVYRKFAQAGLLINQAVNLAGALFKMDNHPYYSDTLMDYGFYFLNYDLIEESVHNYKDALEIRKAVFEKNNLHVAIGLENLAYAHYVNEYSSGNFYDARECSDRAIKIMEKILPSDHLMLASVKRVKALILEEIALDMRNPQFENNQTQYLKEAEALHKEALALSLRAFGERNVQTAKHYGNLGRLYQSMQQYEEAELMHLRAIAIKEELLGPNDYEVGLSIGHLASLYNYHMKRHKEAEQLYLRSIQIGLDLFGESYSGLEYDYRGLVHVYSRLQDINNILQYSQLYREWKEKRKEISGNRPVMTSPQPISIVVEEFLKLC